MKKIVTTILAVVLTACFPVKPDPPSLPPSGKLNIDRALMEDCPEAKKLASGEEEDVVTWGNDLKAKLKECALTKKALVNAIKSVK